ncbi:MAG: pseudaminic acid cytidylyltransferase [Chloroflexi bacterium]|nr:pseudaminic acid cytidylyltransferase [Chloroflexota bacterium]
MTVRRIAVIPARGGSRRIPDKNIRPFCGKPMIGHILEAARASGLFDVIHVSTDSPRIRETVEGLGATVDFMRPRELADDLTPVMPVLRFVVERYVERGRRFDQVWLLSACAPFVEHVDLRAAARRLDGAPPGTSLMTIAQYPVPIEWAYRRAPDGMLTPVQPGMFTVRSQDLEKAYFDTGSFAVLPAASVLGSEGAGTNVGFMGHVIDRTRAVDIDDEEDWALAEALFRQRQGEPSPMSVR